MTISDGAFSSNLPPKLLDGLVTLLLRHFKMWVPVEAEILEHYLCQLEACRYGWWLGVVSMNISAVVNREYASNLLEPKFHGLRLKKECRSVVSAVKGSGHYW